MTQIIYVTDTYKQSVKFIYELISDLQRLGIDDIKHDREHNFIVVENTEVRGMSLCESCLCLKIRKAEYFIDGIDMRNYKDANKERLEWLIWNVKEAMMHFDIEAKQLNGKNDIIKILTENNAEVAE